MSAPAHHAFDEAKHRTGIGSSKAAAVVGLSPWETPLEAYHYYVQAAEQPARVIDSELAHFGHVLEPLIVREFTRRTELPTRRNSRTFRHREQRHMIATPDALITGRRELLECKTADARTIRKWGEAGTDEVPMHYLIQVAHQLAVMDYEVGHLAVLIGGNDFRLYRIVRDRELEQQLLAREAEFWSRVQRRDPPPPSTLGDAAALWPRDAGTTVVASGDVVEAVDRLRAIRAEIRAREQDAEALELAVKTCMAEASALSDGARVIATWKAQTSRRFNTEDFKAAHPDLYESFRTESTSRVLRLK